MWGAQPQNSPYFANYAGVESFLGRCMDGIDFDSTEDNGITGQMETISLGAFLKLLLELACHGPGDEGLAHARRAQQQRALGNSDVIAVVQELLRQHVNGRH